MDDEREAALRPMVLLEHKTFERGYLSLAPGMTMKLTTIALATVLAFGSTLALGQSGGGGSSGGGSGGSSGGQA